MNIGVAGELYGSLLRLKTSFSQKNETSVADAQDWLNKAIHAATQYGIFDEPRNECKVINKLDAGFNTSIFLCDLEENLWVLKVGAKQAPVPGWFDPSSLEYAEWYAHNLNILQNNFASTLPNLIPSPQYVFYPENSKSDRTTLILQPYIKNKIAFEDAVYLSDLHRRLILAELKFFYEVSESLFEKYKFIPDFGSKYNIVIEFINEIPHLVMIDDGMIDFKANSPVLNQWSKFIYHYRVRKMI